MNVKKVLFLLLMMSLFSCERAPEKYTRLEQLEGKPLAVITGTAADVVSREAFPDAEKQNFYSTTDAAYNVKIGKAAAFLFDKAVLSNIVKTYPELTLIDEPVAQARIAIAFNKQRIVMLEEVNTALEKLRSDGTLKTMEKKWLYQDNHQYPALPESEPGNRILSTSPFSEFEQVTDSIPGQQPDDKDVLRIGVCAQFPPMMFVYNNRITGYDMELAIRIGNILGKEIQVIDMSFDSLILSLQAEKIDFAISNFDITEERRKFVNFSDHYLEQDITALVLK